MTPYEQGYLAGLQKVGMNVPFEHIVASANASGLHIPPELQQAAQQAQRSRGLRQLLGGGAIGAGLGLGGYGLYKALQEDES
jgi:hypothetical protein